MVYLRTATYRAECNTVDFLVAFERITGKFYTYIADDTRVVAVIAATVFGTGTALDLHLSLIVTGVTADDESAPVARFTVAFGLFRGKYDRFLGSTLSIEFSAGFYNESGFGVFVAFDDGARFDGEFGSTGDVNPAFEQVSAFGECLFSGEDELLIAVADDVAVEQQTVAALVSSVSSIVVVIVVAASRNGSA